MADLKVKRRVLSACQTNCYYVYREGADDIVIIDPGSNGEIVYDDIKGLGFEKVAGILLTHGHGDHTGGARRLKELSGAKIYAYEDEAEILKTRRKTYLAGLALHTDLMRTNTFTISRHLQWQALHLLYFIRLGIQKAGVVIMLRRTACCFAVTPYLTVL